MKVAFNAILLVIVAFIAAYLIGSLFVWDLNSARWTRETLATVVSGGALVAILSLCIYGHASEDL